MSGIEYLYAAVVIFSLLISAYLYYIHSRIEKIEKKLRMLHEEE